MKRLNSLPERLKEVKHFLQKPKATFGSQAALDNFIKSDGWEAGVDGSIAVAKWGVGKDIGSISFEKPIYAFVFGAKGLMYNLSLEGTKFTKINR